MTSVVFPEPEGPTKARVSPRSTANETSISAGAEAVWWVKLTSSKVRDSSSPRRTGFAGFASTGVARIDWKTSSDASVSR